MCPSFQSSAPAIAHYGYVWLYVQLFHARVSTIYHDPLQIGDGSILYAVLCFMVHTLGT